MCWYCDVVFFGSLSNTLDPDTTLLIAILKIQHFELNEGRNSFIIALENLTYYLAVTPTD